MRPRDDLFARAWKALPAAAAQAVAAAQRFAGDDESDVSPGAAWLLAQRRGGSPDRIAQSLQSAARRGRAGAVIGPPSKRRTLGGRVERERAENARALLAAGLEPTPLQRLEAFEEATLITKAEVAVAGSAALLDRLQHAPGVDLARRLRVTPRRGQQIREAQRAALQAGQQDLFAKEAL